MFLQYYGLNEQPFGVTPDPRFLYMGEAQQEAYASLIYGIETGRGFVALIAGPGLGKTTILLQLMARLQETTRTALLFQTHATSEELLRSLLIDLDVEPQGHDLGDLQRQLGDVLIQGANAGKRFVVAIDEAQNLDDGILEMVRMLSNYETPQAKLLQIILVGQPQLADKLASPQLLQLRQRISIVTHFPPLGGGDVPKYIAHRLKVAGYQGARLLTPAALQLITTHSEGIPRNINNLCFHALSLGFAKNQKEIDEAIIREVIADLSLERLQTSAHVAVKSIPEQPAKQPAVNPEPVGVASAAGRARTIPAPIAPAHSPTLDEVNLGSDPVFDVGDTDFTAERTDGGRTGVSHERKSRVGPVLTFGLATVLVCLWAGSRLKSSVHFLERVARFGGATSRSTTAANSVSLPPAPTNSPGAKPDSAENPSIPNNGAQPGITDENQNSLAPEGNSATGAGNSSVVPAIMSNPTLEPKRNTPHAHEVLHTTDGIPTGSGRLIVESSESGAQITVNGKSNSKWVTPHIFYVASGTYVVSVSRSNFRMWASRVHVDDGQEKMLMATLEDDGTGFFIVDTLPTGMQVFIDGKAFGPSRVETVLRAGWHTCEVIPGPGLQPLVRKFHLGAGESITRRIRMNSPEASLRAPRGMSGE
jgi:general secretion pathway protein A